MNRTTSLATLALLLAFYGTATAQTTRGSVAINGGLQSGSKGFSQDSLVDSPLFGPEDGTLTARHPGGDATLCSMSPLARASGASSALASVCRACPVRKPSASADSSRTRSSSTDRGPSLGRRRAWPARRRPCMCKRGGGRWRRCVALVPFGFQSASPSRSRYSEGRRSSRSLRRSSRGSTSIRRIRTTPQHSPGR